MTVVYHLEQMCVSRGWFLRLHWVIALFQCVVPRIAKKHVENVDSATPVAKESHVERMVRSSLQKALSDLKISNLLCPGSVEIWIFVAIQHPSDASMTLVWHQCMWYCGMFMTVFWFNIYLNNIVCICLCAVTTRFLEAADSLPEMDRILVQLPKPVKDFMAVYGPPPSGQWE